MAFITQYINRILLLGLGLHGTHVHYLTPASIVMANGTRIKRPGFGMPLDGMSKKHDYGETRFPHAIADYFTTDGITLRELTMLELINQITDKPRWTEKIHDETIVVKWRNEACGTKHQQQYSNKHLSEKCFDYVRFCTLL